MCTIDSPKFTASNQKEESIIIEWFYRSLLTNTRNKLLTQKLLKQGYRYHRLHKVSKDAKIRNRYNQVPHLDHYQALF